MNCIKKLQTIYLIILFSYLHPSQCNSASYYSNEEPSSFDTQEKSKSIHDPNQAFWEEMYQTSNRNPKKVYSIQHNDKVCFTCPIDGEIFTSLYQNAAGASGTDAAALIHQRISPAPPRVFISWATQLSDNRLIFFCRNNTRITTSPIHLSSNDYDPLMNNNNPSGNSNSGASDINRNMGDSQLDYTCENNRLCLSNVKNNYPHTYQCMVKSYVLNVKLNVIVQLQYMQLYFIGDSVKFDYQKEVQVHENQMFTLKCEVPESNPASNVAAYIDNREIKLSKLEKKHIDNQMSINTYWFEVNATRSMNGKRIRCEAKMKDLPSELENTLDLTSSLSKEFVLSVHYLPMCVYPKRSYRTGINRTLIIECPINGSNPDVTNYKIIPPSIHTKVEQIDHRMEILKKVGRFQITPKSRADFGQYECIPRSSAGVATCDIHVELGDTPNPPEQCNVQFALVNNKTFAQFSCKPGFNQGGSTSYLTIYERTPSDKSLKFAGRVNIAADSFSDTEIPYITSAEEDKYYEFLIFQENNYGNSTPILLTLGVSQKVKSTFHLDTRTIYMIAAISAVVIFVLFICACCCCSEVVGSNKSDSACCKCCASGPDQYEEESLTYKKAPMDSDGHMNNNQSFPPYSSSSESTSSLANGKLHGQTYDYYDNTSAGLLDNDHYTRNSHYQSKTLKSRTSLNKASVYENKDDEYNHYSHHNMDEEPYMNDDDEITNLNTLRKSNGKNKQRVIISNKQYTIENDDNDESDPNGDQDSLSSAQQTKSGGSSESNERNSYINSGKNTTKMIFKPPAPPVPKQTLTNSTAIFNNNVCVALGSGVESINKRLDLTNNTINNYTKSFKPSSNTNNKFNGSNYSTVDSKNLKLIKTDNGLVYTPINAVNYNSNIDRNKSNDALMLAQEEDEDEAVDEDDDEYTEEDRAIEELNEEEEISGKTEIKTMKMHANNYTKTAMPNMYNNIKKPNHPVNTNTNNNFQNELNIRLKSINNDKDTKLNNNNNNANVTNDMIYSKNYAINCNNNNATNLKITSSNNSTATTSISSASSCASNSDLIINTSNCNTNSMGPKRVPLVSENTNGTNYSLLKTTLNSNTQPALPTQKPPILKPKPKNTNIYATNQQRPHNLTNNDSSIIHNRSIEPLLNVNGPNGLIHSSFNTSPSTSITDVSSTNLTPQHIFNNIDTIDPNNSCNIVKHTTFGTGGLTTTQVTTKTNGNHNNNSYYDSVNLLNGTLNGRKNYNATLGRNNTNTVTIDDEIMAAKNNNSSFISKTLERRHVKNSEC